MLHKLPLLDLIYIYIVMSLLSPKVKKPKLMPFKILMCPEPNKAIIH